MMNFGFIDNAVQVGINPAMDPAQSHGTITVLQPNGDYEVVHYSVDRPNILKRPTMEVIADMYQQFQQLGFRPAAIEVRLGRRAQIYRTDTLH
jgi:hypothetical protein